MSNYAPLKQAKETSVWWSIPGHWISFSVMFWNGVFKHLITSILHVVPIPDLYKSENPQIYFLPFFFIPILFSNAQYISRKCSDSYRNRNWKYLWSWNICCRWKMLNLSVSSNLEHTCNRYYQHVQENIGDVSYPIHFQCLFRT